eukprot:TRINITY_DN18411_c0_g1_i1.p1 TRINITY_DN18411_c0_g1~~TRINITY_DN18411_c0_g1_i1.p1  ORF type:complete len:999 (+),score=334.20 TRINITY_DN18411_c0_g1_i1:202-3198(+)
MYRVDVPNVDEHTAFRTKFSEWVKEGEQGGAEHTVEKKGWCYLKVGSTSKFRLGSGGKGGWCPRYCVARVRLQPEADEPDDGGGLLTVYRSDDTDPKNAVLRLHLTNILEYSKIMLDQSEAKYFPMDEKPGREVPGKRQPKGNTREMKEGDAEGEAGAEAEYRWGHIVFTLKVEASGGGPMHLEFCCQNTLERDSWVEWFMCFLIHKERELMQRPLSPAKLPGKLENSYINKHIKKNFTDHPSAQSGQLEVQDINPCCRLDLEVPPGTSVGWERVRPDCGDGAAPKKNNAVPRRRIRAKLDHIVVDGRSSMGSSAERLELKFADYNFVVENEWSNTFTIRHATNKDLAYKLIAEDVSKRDEWLRWLQYARAVPMVDRALRDRIGWREALLTIRITHARSPKHVDEKKHKCYVDDTGTKLAFRDFPLSVKQWEVETDEAGLRVYRYKNKKSDGDKRGGGDNDRRDNDRPDRLKVRIGDKPVYFAHSYDLYELFFQKRHVTYPNEPAREDGELAEMVVDLWKEVASSPRERGSPDGAVRKGLVRWLSTWRSERRLSDSEFITVAAERDDRPVDYDADDVLAKPFPAPWDLQDDPHIEYMRDDDTESHFTDMFYAPETAAADTALPAPALPAPVPPPLLDRVRGGGFAYPMPDEPAALGEEAASEDVPTTHGSTGTFGDLIGAAAEAPDGQLYKFTANKTGITWADYGPPGRTEIYVKAVAVPSVAYALGIQEGMVLQEVNGVPVTSKDVLVEARAELKRSGRPVVVRLAEGLSAGGFGHSPASPGPVVPAPQAPRAAAPPPDVLAPRPGAPLAEYVAVQAQAPLPAAIPLPSPSVLSSHSGATSGATATPTLLNRHGPGLLGVRGTLKLVPRSGIRSGATVWSSPPESPSPSTQFKAYEHSVSPTVLSPITPAVARGGYSSFAHALLPQHAPRHASQHLPPRSSERTGHRAGCPPAAIPLAASLLPAAIPASVALAAPAPAAPSLLGPRAPSAPQQYLPL